MAEQSLVGAAEGGFRFVADSQGDLADPPSFRNALRGVQTVVHLAASIRDQPRGGFDRLSELGWVQEIRTEERYQRLAADYSNLHDDVWGQLYGWVRQGGPIS